LAFIDAIDTGKGHVLAATPLPAMRHNDTGNQYRIIILVKQMDNPREVQVCMTAKVFWLDQAPNTSLTTRLLSHNSPINHQISDEEMEMIRTAFCSKVDDTVEYGSFGSVEAQVQIHKFVRTSNIEKLRSILKNQDLDLTATDTLGWTPLHWAVVQKEFAQPMTMMLLDHGAGPDPKSASVKSPLLLAIEHGEDSVIKTLLGYGAAQTPFLGASPLAQALYCQRSPDIIETLILRGADVNLFDDFGKTPLFYAMNSESLEILLKSGANASAYDRSGRSMLHLAAIHDESSFIQKLVQFGAAVDILEQGSGYTSLHHAIINQNEGSVRVLLDLYANANRQYQDGKTVLMHSILTRNFGIIESM
jgi:ankyrin repeat protein